MRIFTIFFSRTTAPSKTIFTPKLVRIMKILIVKTVTPGLKLGPQEGFKDYQKSIEKIFCIIFHKNYNATISEINIQASLYIVDSKFLKL